MSIFDRYKDVLYLATMMRLRWTWVTMPLLMVLACSLGGTAAAQTIEGTTFEERSYADAAGAQRIGINWACATVTAPDGDPNQRLLLLVTSPAAVPAAEQIGSELSRAALVEVRVVRKRYRQTRLEVVHRRAHETRPADVQGIGFGGDAKRLYRDTCGRVDLVILPKGHASPASERWARRFVERYGRDRVSVTRGRAWPR